MSDVNLYQRLLAITQEIGKIDKTGRNSQQGYTFIEQAQVVAEVRAQLAKHGVMIIPETISRTIDRFENAKGTTMFHANVVSRYTLINVDNPEERMVCEWDAGEALDSSDKATNKATTASNKYFLMKLFNISDKDDPDSESPEPPKPGPKITDAQIVELIDMAKGKGFTSKETAVGFLNEITALPDFRDLPQNQLSEVKKAILAHKRVA